MKRKAARYVSYKLAKLSLRIFKLSDDMKRWACHRNGGIYIGDFKNMLLRINLENMIKEYEEQK